MYSSLRFLLEERGLTVGELARRIAEFGGAVDARTLQRLTDPDRTLRQVDARVLDLVCRALGVALGDFLVFAEPLAPRLRRLSPTEQARLDELLDRHGEEELRGRELEELRRLVAEVGEIGIANARQMIEHRERVREAAVARRHTAAD